MAGAGYKLYATGDVLTAAQVNNYLQEQTVMVFADAAARTTALASVLAEGMISYLKDTNSTEYYSGSAWVAIGGGGGGGGKVLQVVQGTATTNTSSSSSSYVDVSLSASITPSATSSKVLAIVSAVAYIDASSGTRNLHVQLVRGATSIAEQEPALLSNTNGTTGSLAGGIGFSYLDSPSTTSATTYKIQACMKDQTSSFIFNYNNSLASIVLMEIGA